MISVVGIGPGHRHFLTPLAQQQIEQSDWLVGSARQLALFSDFTGNKRLLSGDLSQLIDWLAVNQQRNITILASGDPMLYGIGKRLYQHFSANNIVITPGISAIQYLFSRIGLDMNDLYLTSSHGKQPDFDFIFQHDKVAMVTDQKIGPYQIDQQIKRRQLKRFLIIGENLSYSNERILIQPPQIALHYDMNVVIILKQPLNDGAEYA